MPHQKYQSCIDACKQGARVFARPAWQAATQAITSLLMLFFAARLLLRLR